GMQRDILIMSRTLENPLYTVYFASLIIPNMLTVLYFSPVCPDRCGGGLEAPAPERSTNSGEGYLQIHCAGHSTLDPSRRPMQRD
ncbi:MAG: hypothetical protein LBC19_09475, partial [Tannerella sp.]|nr:hypothetical protein [Tannerella sp.]